MRRLISRLVVGLTPIVATIAMTAAPNGAYAIEEYSVFDNSGGGGGGGGGDGGGGGGGDWSDLSPEYLHDSGLQDVLDYAGQWLEDGHQPYEPSGTSDSTPTTDSDPQWSPGESSWELPGQYDFFEWDDFWGTVYNYG